jgi:hypothetical protein
VCVCVCVCACTSCIFKERDANCEMYVVICMRSMCVLCVCERERARARAHARIHTLFFSVSLFFCLYCPVTSFVSISLLCMHMMCYNTKHTHTHTHRGSRIHQRALFSRHTSACDVSMCAYGAYVQEQTEALLHTRVKRLAARATPTSVCGLKLLVYEALSY